jgi:ketosteroid isomerase-like protein
MDHDKIVKNLFQSIDLMDSERFAGFVTDDAVFKFGNAEAVSGRPAIKEAVAGFFSTLSGISHNIQTVVHNDSSIMLRGEVTYTRKDSSKITLPFANYFGMEQDLIKDYLIYMDVNPLYAAESK